MPRILAITATAYMFCVACSSTNAQTTGRVDSSNVGIATEDAVIASGLPNASLDTRSSNEGVDQQLMDTASPDYPDLATGANSQEYMIFKFDFSSLPPGASATSTGSFDFSAWYTRNEGEVAESLFGRFEFFEITQGDAGWTDGFISAEIENQAAVTWSSLNGTFVRLANVEEDNTDPPENTTGNPFGILYPGILVSNGGFDGANRVVGIPILTLNRLISGESVGLAMGSLAPRLSTSAGDYDGDNDVDGHDFLTWQQQLAASVGIGQGADGSQNGLVDAEDLQIWSSNFGDQPPLLIEGTTHFSIHTTESFFSPGSAPTLNFDWFAPASQTVNVPEPRSICFGMVALVVTWAWSGRCGSAGLLGRRPPS